MATRSAYTSLDELRMWKFVIKKLAENQSGGLKGLQMWTEYFKKYDESRSVSSLSSHFRKKMCPHLIDASLTVDEKLYIHRIGNIPLDLERFKLQCRTMGKMDIFDKHMELLESNKSSAPGSERKEKVNIRRRPAINNVVNDTDEINKVISTCKNSSVLKAPKLEENGSDNDSIRVNVNDENLSVDDNLEMHTSLKISESMRQEQNAVEVQQPSQNPSEETIQDGQGLHLSEPAESDNPQPAAECGSTDFNEEPEQHLTIQEIKDKLIKEMCVAVDSKLGVFVSLNVLIRKEIFYISASATCRKDLIDKLHEFKEKFMEYINEVANFESFFLEIEKKDIVMFNRTKFETVRKVENSVSWDHARINTVVIQRIPEVERDKYYRKAHIHLRKSPCSKLFRIQHRLQCIEAVAASLSSMKENFYYSIMEELFRELGLML
ncbi:unnamed protein product [Auanema sp. JU1783]|nr:unnamed protein product [Auanema sp. JU1783]